MLDSHNRFRWPHVAIMTAVLFLHMTLLVFLLAHRVRLISPPPDKAHTASNALILRLHVMPSKKARSMPIPSKSRVQDRFFHHPVKPKKVIITSGVRKSSQPGDGQQPALDLNLTSAAEFASGATERPSPSYSRQNIRIPGSRWIANDVPRFRMVDPKSQGIAGAIRIVGGIFGAVNPHCVDVDVWRGMTPKERIEKHLDISDEKIEAIADRYNCLPPLKPGDPMYYRRR